ncbi:MAG: hypothetical protein NC397_04310 [Clostridium sp.]|nr:hypothetical protein [Clostridium sp.]
MTKNLKLNYLLVGLFLAFLAIFVFSHTDVVGYASDKPESEATQRLYCTYYDEAGNEVDGGRLTAGTYDVEFVVEGFDRLSILEVTSVLGKNVISYDITYLMSDVISNDMVSMGTVNDGKGNLVFGFVSNGDYTPYDGGPVVLATVRMTFAADDVFDADSVDYITVSENPNLTFIITDSSVEEDVEYALVESFQDYTGALIKMQCDVTPSNGHDISASLVVMTGADNATANTPVYGEYVVDVYADADRTDLVQSVTSGQSEDGSNSFTISSLADGTYYLSISSTYAITRDDIVLTVSGSDIADVVIPIVACDFNGNGAVAANDALTVYTQAAGDGELYCDLNGNGGIAANDALIVYSLAALDSYYNGFEIK